MSTFVAAPGVAWLRRTLYQNVPSPRVRYLDTVETCARSARRILDLGCGYQAKVLDGVPTTAIKVGIDLVEHFSPRPEANLRLARADGSQLPFVAGAFDLVFCRAVLEHVLDTDRLFAEISRVLAPGGRFVFMTPNFYDVISLAAAVIPNRLHGPIVQRLTGRAEADTFPTHYHANTLRRLRALAREHGFVPRELETIREHPHYLQTRLSFYLAGTLFEQIVQRPFSMFRPWIIGHLEKIGQ